MFGMFLKKEIVIRGWQFHNAKINRVSWSSNSLHLVSGGLDGSVYIWSVQNPTNRIHFKDAHKGGVNDVVFISDNVVASAGQDCALKTWTINF